VSYKRVWIALLFSLGLSLALAAVVSAVPPVPVTVYGRVQVNGADVAPGSPVVAWISGTAVAQSVVVTDSGQSVYVIDIPGDPSWDPGGGPPPESGRTITFTVNGNPMDQSVTWSEGLIQSVNLSGTAARGMISGTISLQGHGSAPSSRYVLTLTLRFYPQGETVSSFTTAVATDEQGRFTLTDLTPGTYTVCVRNPHSLTDLANGVQIMAGGTAQMAALSLLEGDANGDDWINILDFSLLASAFSKRSGQSGFNPLADFNDDGVVDILDFSLLAMNFNVQGDCRRAGLQ